MRNLVKRRNSYRRRHIRILAGEEGRKKEEGGRRRIRCERVFLKGFATFHAFASLLCPIFIYFFSPSGVKISGLMGLFGLDSRMVRPIRWPSMDGYIDISF